MTTLGLSFAVAFALAAGCSPLAVWLGKRLGMVARPDARRLHRGEISRLGGLGLFVAFITVALALFWLHPLPDPADRLRLAGVILGCVWMFVLGWMDDRWELSPRWQLAGQTVAAAIAIATTIIIERITNPFTGHLLIMQWWIYVPLSWFWITGMINTVNWLDGLDGLAVGVGAIAAALFTIHLYQLGQTQIAPYALALCGACLGVLPFNFAPARIFLGGGALVLGYLLATLAILAPARAAITLMVLVIPITDTAWQIVDRLRQGHSPFRGDRGHLHFRLVDRGYSMRKIVIAYWLFCLLFGGMALFLESGLYKLVALGIMVLLLLALMATLSGAFKPAATTTTPKSPPTPPD